MTKSYHLKDVIVKNPGIISMDHAKQEPVLQEAADNNPFIKLIYITNTLGKKITKNITQKTDSEVYHRKLNEHGDFSGRAWFAEVMKQKKVYFSDLYTSKVTELLCITVSAPITGETGAIIGVLGIDIKFDDLIKL